jgi:hypothetical protein
MRINNLPRTAFGELQTAQYKPETVWSFAYNINTDLFETTETNTGTVTHSRPNAVLQTGTNSAGGAKIETKRAIRYQPGIGGRVMFTAVFNTPVADSLQIIGVGDDNDGFFFGYDGLRFGCLRRNNGTDYWTYEEEWNVRTNSNVKATNDWQKLNVFQIQFQWLGGGEIKFFVEQNYSGMFELMHRVKYAGTETTTSVQNPSFPVMAEVKNLGNTSNLTLLTPSGSAGSEGIANGASTTTNGLDTQRTTNGTVPVITLRNNTTYAGQTNRTRLRVKFITFTTGNNRDSIYRLVKNGSLTGASYSDISATTTPGESDVSATAITGGTQLASTSNTISSTNTINSDDLEMVLAPGEWLSVVAVTTQSVESTIGITYENEF